MDTQLVELMREVEETSQERGGVPRLDREAGQFLSMLAKIARAANLLEVGTQDGYTTLWLTDAVAATGGRVTTVERDVWQLANAKKLFARSPHGERIQLVQGAPEELLPVLEGPFDFILLDAEPEEALHYFHILIEKIPGGALICCAKAISKAGILAPYLAYVHERSGLESMLAPIGEGIEITYKVP
jgi:predicted O-methyltransferase YrrM